MERSVVEHLGYGTPVPGVLLALALTVFIFPSDRVAWAQTGTMSGRVVDEGGVGLPGANVLLKGSRIGAVADDGGRFHILKVPVGTYTVIARTVGFAPSERAGVRVRANQDTIVEFKLTSVPVRLSRGVEIVGTPKIEALGGQRITATRGDFQADSVALFGALRRAGARAGTDAPCDSTQAGEQEPLVQIGFRLEPRPGICTYVYTVLNRTQDTLTAVQIGYDTEREQCELTG